MNVGRLKPQLFSSYSTGCDRDRKDYAGLEELILVREVLNALLVNRQVQTKILTHQLLRSYLKHILLIGPYRLYRRNPLKYCHRRNRCGLGRAGQQQVLGRRGLEEPVVRSAKCRLGPRDEIRNG